METSLSGTTGEGEGAALRPLAEQTGTGRRSVELRISELNTLRKALARYPQSRRERREAVEVCLSVMRRSPNERHVLSAIRTLVAMEALNQDEVRLLLASEGRPAASSSSVAAPAQAAQLIVNGQLVLNATTENVLQQYADVLEERSKAPPTVINVAPPAAGSAGQASDN